MSLALLYALAKAAIRSWRGLAQLLLFISFFGPISLVEMALAPPTAFLLSRMVSRARIYEADDRGRRLSGDSGTLVSALHKLERVEASPAGRWPAYLRFSLFVAPRPQTGYQAWLARLYATHTPIASRIDALRAPARSPVRATAGPP